MTDSSTFEIRHSQFASPWTEVNAWRRELHRDFERALAETKLPERPDYEAANGFLLKARRLMVNLSAH
jgi:hypothetical protein